MNVRNEEKFVIKIFHFTPLRDLKEYSHATLVFRVATDAADDSSCSRFSPRLLDVTSMRKLKIVGITKDHKIFMNVQSFSCKRCLPSVVLALILFFSIFM